MPSFLTTLAGKVIAGIVGIILIFALITYLQWDKAAQPKQDARSANAAAQTAKEAALTVIDRSGKDADIDGLVENTAKLIDTLPPAQAGKEARKAICSLPEYAKDKSCTN
jgi:type II secretory pathway pseudopilin PulG